MQLYLHTELMEQIRSTTWMCHKMYSTNQKGDFIRLTFWGTHWRNAAEFKLYRRKCILQTILLMTWLSVLDQLDIAPELMQNDLFNEKYFILTLYIWKKYIFRHLKMEILERNELLSVANISYSTYKAPVHFHRNSIGYVLLSLLFLYEGNKMWHVYLKKILM